MSGLRVRGLLALSATALGAFYLGSRTERLQQSSDVFPRLPGLPTFGTVSAASLVASNVNLTATPSRISEIMKFGFPGLDNVRSHSDYVLSYDRRNRIPHWVFEHLTAESVAKNDSVDRSKCDFKPDESIHPFFRSQNTDYRKSGFDRGHMAAAGNHRLHQKHCEETFYLSNMAPQVGQGFNRDAWNSLEMHVRKLTKSYSNVYVCTGPLYLPHKEDDGKMYVKYEVIGSNTVAVPTHFYKVIVGEAADHKLHMEAYVMPNKVISNDTPLNVFQVPPETVERAAGLLFFDQINRNQLASINGRKV
ncbi:GL11082 [Drosophila persimilis]|uniref:Endonuclease n=1 Tax=Drosophila persimilis TaxID=7234 RepID=B4GBU8_DROPE|nr:endonuclease G, mitochondrial [Drosophila persimilis]XP_026843387.1 endonuclease G, mitochondrial [Drosophila persimilis]EDW31327.1 GL11082 [Drosophila persimilis]